MIFGLILFCSAVYTKQAQRLRKKKSPITTPSSSSTTAATTTITTTTDNVNIEETNVESKEKDDNVDNNATTIEDDVEKLTSATIDPIDEDDRNEKNIDNNNDNNDDNNNDKIKEKSDNVDKSPSIDPIETDNNETNTNANANDDNNNVDPRDDMTKPKTVIAEGGNSISITISTICLKNEFRCIDCCKRRRH